MRAYQPRSVLGPKRKLALLALAQTLATSCSAPTTTAVVVTADPPRGVPQSPVVLPAVLDYALDIPPHAMVNMTYTTHVVRGGRLRVGAGAKMVWAHDTGLIVEGGYVHMDGQPADPVVLTSSATGPEPGAWFGVAFTGSDKEGGDDGPLTPVSTLKHTIVEYAGARRPCSACYAAGVSVVTRRFLAENGLGGRTNFAGRVALRHVLLRHNANRGLFVESPDYLDGTMDVQFEPNNNGVSASLAPALVPMLGADVPEVVEVQGYSEKGFRFPRFKQPYLFGQLSLHTINTEQTWTIDPGTTIRLAWSRGISITGELAPARLVARGVTFTSAESEPKAGDWGPISVSRYGQVDLADSVIEWGGAENKVTSAAAVLVYSYDADTAINVTGTIFRHIKGPAVRARDCRILAGIPLPTRPSCGLLRE